MDTVKVQPNQLIPNGAKAGDTVDNNGEFSELLGEVTITASKTSSSTSSSQDNTYVINPILSRNLRSEGNTLNDLKNLNKTLEIINEFDNSKFKFAKYTSNYLDGADILFNSKTSKEAIDKIQNLAIEKAATRLIGSNTLFTAMQLTYNYMENSPSQVAKSALQYRKEALHYRAMYRRTNNPLYMKLESKAMDDYNRRAAKFMELHEK